MKLSVFLLVAILFSFSSRAANVMDKWPELNEFHGVMAGTFHPSEDGNLAPVKQRIDEFVKKAHKLAQSKIPAEFSNDKVKTSVLNLDKGAVELKKLIDTKASDDQIKKKLSSLHDTFHEIIGACTKDHKE